MNRSFGFHARHRSPAEFPSHFKQERSGKLISDWLKRREDGGRLLDGRSFFLLDHQWQAVYLSHAHTRFAKGKKERSFTPWMYHGCLSIPRIKLTKVQQKVVFVTFF